MSQNYVPSEPYMGPIGVSSVNSLSRGGCFVLSERGMFETKNADRELERQEIARCRCGARMN